MKRRILALCCAVSLVLSLLAGCQQVGGVEPDKVLSNLLNVESYEGTASIKLELALGQLPEGYPDYTPLKQASIVLQSVKQQDKTHKLMAGELRYGGGAIPFQAYKAGDETVLQVQGGGKPAVWGPAEEAPSDQGTGSGESSESELPFDISKLDWLQLFTEYGSSLLKYMPNAEILTVEDAKATVNGQVLELKKVHTEVKGAELAGLIQTMISNLLADKEQGDALLRQIVKWYLGEEASDTYVSIATQFVKKYLELLTDLNDTTLLEASLPYLNDGNALKLDLYVDGDSQVRRYEYELNVTGLKLYEGAVTGFKAVGTEDRWSINQPVSAPPIDASDAVKLSAPAGLAKFVKTLDPTSQAYKLLVNDLKVARKNIQLPPIEEGLPGETVRPYIDPEYEVTMVPVRFVTEKLDADVQWIGATQQVIVTDIWTGKTLVFSIGSNTVLVNGSEVTLEARAALTGDSTYVPARFIAEAFGAEVGWDGETRTVSIIRN